MQPLQAAGNKLGCAGGSAVDQDRQRLIRERLARGVHRFTFIIRAALVAQGSSGKNSGNLAGSIQESPGIVSQVKDVSGYSALLQIADCVLYRCCHIRGELCNANVADLFLARGSHKKFHRT